MTDIDEKAFALAFSRNGKYSRTIGRERFVVEKYEAAKDKIRESKKTNGDGA